MNEIQKQIAHLQQGNIKSLARCISIVENELDGYEEILFSIYIRNTPIIGITGPPGSGKSTLINSILKKLVDNKKRIGVIAIDPTSPFNYGSFLGDRIRMTEHFNNENIFIRSLATRGSLGGLSAKTIEVADVMKAFGFDYIFIETVGVGQSEVEIAGIADTTILVLAPGFGDEIQTIKSGIMEIGDIFVINKSDQPNADVFAKNISQLIERRKYFATNTFHLSDKEKNHHWKPPIVKTVATQNEGIEEIICKIEEHSQFAENIKKIFILTEKAYRLIQQQRMKNVDKKKLQSKIEKEMKKKDFNLYGFVKTFS
ncbi:MAG: methylmalonyl Co-A mutase-associated GTPase MeaB [Bacteroidota bacterium]